MNWKNGLFRIWLVLSAIWVVLITLLARPDIAYQRYTEAKSGFESIRERARGVDINICKQFGLMPWQKYDPSTPVASNPQTGEAVRLDENGQWVPIQQQPIEIALSCYRYF